MTLSHGPEEVVGEGILAEETKSLIVNLVGRDVGCQEQNVSMQKLHRSSKARWVLTGLGDGLLGESLNGSGLVALSVDELVVDDLHARVVGREHGNLIGDSLGVGEGGNVLANIGEAHDDALGSSTGQLSLGLFTKNDNIGLRVLSEQAAGGLGQARVNTTAKTLVRAGHNVKSLLVLQGLGLGLLEDSVGGLSVVARFIHSLLGAGETGRGNDLHGVGDLLNVLDGLEASLDLTQSREGGGIGGRSAVPDISSPRGRQCRTVRRIQRCEISQRRRRVPRV